MSLLFIVLDTVVKFGFVIVFGFFIRSLVRGDFRLNPNHTYAEAMEPEQCKTLTCGECYACESYEAYREGELRVHAYGIANQYHHWSGSDGVMHMHEGCRDKFQAEETQLYQFFEVWLDKKDISHACEYCG
jgi:hypothetical protein